MDDELVLLFRHLEKMEAGELEPEETENYVILGRADYGEEVVSTPVAQLLKEYGI